MDEQIKLTLNEEEIKTPELELEGIAEPKLDLTTEEVVVPPVGVVEYESSLDESKLTEEEKKVVDDFVDKIDVKNSTLVLQYGSAAQKKVAAFSDTALEKVKTRDLGEIGNDLSNLVVELKGFDSEEEKGFKGFFKNTTKKARTMQAKYTSASANVEKIAATLEGHQMQLMKDIVMLDKLYEMNLNYQKELTMYIIAGKKKLQKERETTLVELTEKAKQSGLAEDAQEANDFAQQCDAFEKKLHDLELTRMVSVQMSPQIRLLQNNDKIMTDKIQSTLVNTIPLWKSQMVLALGVSHSQQAVKAQRDVSNMTNELLRKNAETLKMSTIETAKESERGIVDLETLKVTNQSLITTLDEVIKIQDEGRAKRREAEQEITRLEGELKQKLLDIRS